MWNQVVLDQIEFWISQGNSLIQAMIRSANPQAQNWPRDSQSLPNSDEIQSELAQVQQEMADPAHSELGLVILVRINH